MRIIAKQKDYYDTALGFGHDDTIVYARQEEILYPKNVRDEKFPEEFKPLLCQSRIIQEDENRVTFKIITILFCGKLYGGIQVELSINTVFGPKIFIETFYDEESLLKFLSKYKIVISIEDKKKSFWSSNYNRTIKEQIKLRADAKFFDLAIKYMSPIIVIEEGRYSHKNTIIKNALLKKYQFYKVIDAYQAFQEIDMFLSGVLAPENRPVTEIADKYKIQEHGFDKWSFRNCPTKK